MPAEVESAEALVRPYSSMIKKSYIELFRDRYPHVDIYDILSYSEIDPATINDPLTWITQEQSDRFFERMCVYFDNPLKIAREAGRYIYNDRTLGLFKRFSIEIMGVGFLYKNAPKYANMYSRAATYTSTVLGSNKYKITCTIKKGVKESEYQNYNRLGSIEGATLLYSDKIANVEYYPEGDDKKVFVVEWEKPTSEKISILRSYFILLDIPLLLALFFTIPLGAAVTTLLLSIIVLLGLTYLRAQFKYQESRELHKIHKSSADKIVKMFIADCDQVKHLNTVGGIVLGHTDLKAAMADISALLVELNYRNHAYFLIEPHEEEITQRFCHGFNAGLADLRLEAHHANRIQRAFLGPVIFAEPAEVSTFLGIDASDYFRSQEFPIILVPIIYDQTIIGFLFISPDSTILPIGQKKLDFLSGVASQISLGYHKSLAFNELIENEIKSNFLSTASHELKTPIQILMMGLSDIEKTANLEENLPILKGQIDKLNSVVSNFLDFQAIESKGYDLDFESVPVQRLIEFLQSDMSSTARFYGHEFEIVAQGYEAAGPGIVCNLKNLATAIINLFNNSCKYTSEKGSIILRLRRDDAHHEISVIDNGLGIPKRIQNKVFIRFFHHDLEGSHSVDGCGLGLSISNEIVRLHGGGITTESPLHHTKYPDLGLGLKRRGTCVTIRLPLHGPAAQVADGAGCTHANKKGVSSVKEETPLNTIVRKN